MIDSIKIGVWGHDDVYGKLDGGFPLVVFDKAMSEAVVLSPLNTFMSANQMSFTDQNTKEKALTFGPLSSIDSVSDSCRLHCELLFFLNPDPCWLQLHSSDGVWQECAQCNGSVWRVDERVLR